MTAPHIHIYTTPAQPATRYTDHHCTPPCEFTTPANRLLWAHCCKRRRPAKNLVVHVYYDHTGVFCATGKGCRSAKVLRAKRRREYLNRSRAATAAWAARRAATGESERVLRLKRRREYLRRSRAAKLGWEWRRAEQRYWP